MINKGHDPKLLQGQGFGHDSHDQRWSGPSKGNALCRKHLSLAGPASGCPMDYSARLDRQDTQTGSREVMLVLISLPVGHPLLLVRALTSSQGRSDFFRRKLLRPKKDDTTSVHPDCSRLKSADKRKRKRERERVCFSRVCPCNGLVGVTKFSETYQLLGRESI